jgi:hypothetical protein
MDGNVFVLVLLLIAFMMLLVFFGMLGRIATATERIASALEAKNLE